MSAPSSFRFLRGPLPITTAAVLFISVIVLPREAKSEDSIHPFDGPWGGAPVQVHLEKPKEKSFLKKLLPGGKKEGKKEFLAEPKPKPKPEPEPNPISVWVGNKLKREPKPAAAAEPKPEPALRDHSPLSPLGWFQRDPKPAPAPEPKPERVPTAESRSIFGWFKSEPPPSPGVAPDIRFEPRTGPTPSPDSTASTQSRDIFEWLPGRDSTTPPAKPSTEAAPSSGGFLSRFDLMRDSEPEPTTVAATTPEPESESGGLFGLFKSNSSKPQPELKPEPRGESGESGGLFGLFKGGSPEPEPDVVAETQGDTESSGFFSRINPWKSSRSEPDPAPETTLEVDPAPEPDSGRMITRFTRKPAEKPAAPAPAPTISEKPVSDAAIATALESKPAASSSSGGFLSKILPGGNDKSTETRMATRENRPEPAPDPVIAESKPIKRTVHFESDIKPIFESKCISCHNRDTLHGRVSLESRNLAFTDTPEGRVIVPGSPDSSILFQNVISARTTSNPMPPMGHSITRKEKNLIYAWIKEGAHWPEGSSGQLVAY